MCALRQARAEIVMDEDNRSRGYGTIRFESKADAATAIEVSVVNRVAPSVLLFVCPLVLYWRPFV